MRVDIVPGESRDICREGECRPGNLSCKSQYSGKLGSKYCQIGIEILPSEIPTSLQPEERGSELVSLKHTMVQNAQLIFDCSLHAHTLLNKRHFHSDLHGNELPTDDRNVALILASTVVI